MPKTYCGRGITLTCGMVVRKIDDPYETVSVVRPVLLPGRELVSRGCKSGRTREERSYCELVDAASSRGCMVGASVFV